MTACLSTLLPNSHPRQIRQAIRNGDFRGFTNSIARDYVQGNLVIVPASHADDFAAYCALNHQALPLLGRSLPGSAHIPHLAADLDLRTDVGGYMVFRNGELVDTPSDITPLWRDDFVAFVLGCSFSFERVLQNEGVHLRHLEEGNVSAMYVTNQETAAAGRFSGPLVVSMRALQPADAIKTMLICSRYPSFHGTPIHIGAPHMIGIDDMRNSYGGHGLTSLKPNELPVFWACGATAQTAATRAKLPWLITHYKAHMVLTDMLISDTTIHN